VSNPNLQELEELRIIYKEIVDGYSFYEDKGVCVKHLTDLENTEVTKQKRVLYTHYRKDLPTEEEKLQQLIETEQWSKAQEEEILQYQYIITDNEKNLKNIIPQQHGPILQIIEANKKALNKLLREKRSLMGRTAEEFAERDTFYYMVYLAMYKDTKLKTRCFADFTVMEEMEDDEIKPYVDMLDSTMRKFTEEAIKKIAVLPIFLNPLSYAKDSVYHFLGKPLINVTPFQMNLLSLGTRNLNIMGQSEGEPPALLDDVKINDVVNWYDQQYSIILGKRNRTK
jgi:hypothetical protein